MLISFTLANWKSFRDEATLSMIPSRERRFGWTIPTFPDVPKKLLPIAAIYGSNASGKTNFFNGLSFFRDYVVQGVEAGAKIPVVPYRLDPEMKQKPTFFSVALRTEGAVFQYSIELTSNEVISEKLIRFINGTTEIVLFDRKKGQPIQFDQSVEDQRNFFVFEGTQNNLAFLTNAYKQKISFVAPVYEWLKSKVVFIGTTTYYGSNKIFKNNSPFQNSVSNYLSKYDTGIVNISSETTKIPHKGEQFTYLAEGEDEVIPYKGGERIRLIKENDSVKISILNSIHHDCDGNKIKFNFRDESDGTKRLLDLLPALIMCHEEPEKEQVYIIDEIDRSLHPNLLYQMVTEFLEHCSSKTRFQLIMTTHDTGLMNQDLLRRDEIWIANKSNGKSSIYSISDYKNVRFDKILDKLYKEGRFGGVPRIITPKLPTEKK